jgi:hypothetical protein
MHIMEDFRSIVRKIPLSDEGAETGLEQTTAADRIKLVWQLTRDAWAFKGQPLDESTFPRHAVRVVRGRR